MEDFEMTGKIRMKSSTMSSFLENKMIDSNKYFSHLIQLKVAVDDKRMVIRIR